MLGVPGQPLAVDVTVIVPLIGLEPLLVPVKAGALPVPLAAKPMVVLVLLQAKVLPATGLVYTAEATAVPLQTVLLVGTTTVGVGLTVMV